MPPWSVTLRNDYWILRNLRSFDSAGRCRLYRKIQAEKKRLAEELGVDQEEIRLVCRMLSNLNNRNAEMRWKAYAAQLKLAL
jgi:hypothetical protein